MEKKYCYKCGTQLEVDVVYCSSCGTKLINDNVIDKDDDSTTEQKVEKIESEVTIEKSSELQESLKDDSIIDEEKDSHKTKIRITAGLVCLVVIAFIIVIVAMSCKKPISVDGRYFELDGDCYIDFNNDSTFDFYGDLSTPDDTGTFEFDEESKEVYLTFDSDRKNEQFYTDGVYIYSSEYSGDAVCEVKNQTFEQVEENEYNDEIVDTNTITLYDDGTYERTYETSRPDDSDYETYRSAGNYEVQESTGVITFNPTEYGELNECEPTCGIVRDGIYYDVVYLNTKKVD